MASEVDTTDRAPTRGVTNPEWPAQATDALVKAVDSVRDKTAGPATSIARGVVYGLLAAVVGTAALVLLLIVLVRVIDVGVGELLDVVDIERRGRSTWIAHALVGILFLLPGLWAWRKGWRAPAV